jgi:nucleoside-diphosphate-sugar epimerase
LPRNPCAAGVHRVLVTGISGNLGRRLAPLLSEYDLLSVDLHPPPPGASTGKFFKADLSTRAGQIELTRIVQDEPIDAVLHLAFVIDPVRTGIVARDRMWQANVAATQQLLEAVAARNRSERRVRLFVFLSSVSAYGPDLPERVREDAPLRAHTLPYAIHKREADLICQKMHASLGGCSVYLYRPHIYAGPTVDNYILRAIRGQPSGGGRLARIYAKHGWKSYGLLPKSSDGGELQFVHVDDVARVLLWTLKNFRDGQLEIFNLAGSGPPITFGECTRLAGTPVLRFRSVTQIRWALRLLWMIGLSGVPPESIPYYLTSYTMDTTRLRAALGPACDDILRFTSREALLDALKA